MPDKQNEELIPVEQVLEDMYADKGVVSWAARDYYYLHYADEVERKHMNREEKMHTIIACTIHVIIISLLLVAIIAVITKEG